MLLQAFDGAIVAITHNKAFADNLRATHVLRVQVCSPLLSFPLWLLLPDMLLLFCLVALTQYPAAIASCSCYIGKSALVVVMTSVVGLVIAGQLSCILFVSSLKASD